MVRISPKTPKKSNSKKPLSHLITLVGRFPDGSQLSEALSSSLAKQGHHFARSERHLAYWGSVHQGNLW